MTTFEAYDAWLAADSAWFSELVCQYGASRASGIRHTPKAHGLPGSKLHKLYQARVKATETYNRVTVQAAE